MSSLPDVGRLQAVLFDFDGVVVQSEDVYDRATLKLGNLYGVKIPKAFYETNRGIAEELFYDRFMSAFNLKVDSEELQENGRRILWGEFSNSVQYTPGFLQFLSKVREKVNHVGLVTATPRPLINEIFQNSDISVDFDCIITSSDVERTKPAPDPYLKTCEFL